MIDFRFFKSDSNIENLPKRVFNLIADKSIFDTPLCNVPSGLINDVGSSAVVRRWRRQRCSQRSGQGYLASHRLAGKGQRV